MINDHKPKIGFWPFIGFAAFSKAPPLTAAISSNYQKDSVPWRLFKTTPAKNAIPS
jgi:hypothetical protein